MPKGIDLTGERFGALVVRKRVGLRNGCRDWECVCDCGNVVNVTSGALRSKECPRRSCGCKPRKSRRHDLTGAKFGRWKVLEFSGVSHQNDHWLCECECGVRKQVFASSLRSGASRSCGCLASESSSKRSFVHGMTNSQEYVAWANMITRCKESETYCKRFYFDRGIRVCDRWKNSFIAFHSDMGDRPGDGYSIDRIDNDGNYEPGNCRWATRGEQSRNKRTTRIVEIDGESMCLSDWCRKFGITTSRVYYHMSAHGASAADAINYCRKNKVKHEL